MDGGHEPMVVFGFDAGKELIVRLKSDTELIRSITELARNRGIAAGSFAAIGALKRARLAYFDQKDYEYREIAIETPHEMASCIGNVSLKDGEPFIHAHVVLADETGNTRAGHLVEGIVFAAEVHLHELQGPKLERRYDKMTRLSLWNTE
jgi:predicted DNA-binding protein with PD1-like motif